MYTERITIRSKQFEFIRADSHSAKKVSDFLLTLMRRSDAALCAPNRIKPLDSPFRED